MFAQSAILPSPSMTQGIPTSLDMAFGKGDVETISTHLADNVKLTIQDTTETVKKDVAVTRLTEFFEANPARGFHMQSSVGEMQHTGELTTITGVYSVGIHYKDSPKKQSKDRKITELEIKTVSSHVSQ
jgi:hypothetical protein